mgnify:CR=1 FL=1
MVKKASVIEEKKNGLISENKEDDSEIIPMFRELYSSNIADVLRMFGKNSAPLSILGHFLNFTGNHLLNYVAQKHKKNIFY